ncbi:hypothetical protein LXL04_020819 [Taraxacum kok-saghyz]
MAIGDGSGYRRCVQPMSLSTVVSDDINGDQGPTRPFDIPSDATLKSILRFPLKNNPFECHRPIPIHSIILPPKSTYVSTFYFLLSIF